MVLVGLVLIVAGVAGGLYWGFGLAAHGLGAAEEKVGGGRVHVWTRTGMRTTLKLLGLCVLAILLGGLLITVFGS